MPAIVQRSPLIVCCGYPLVWESFEDGWCAYCWQCFRDFAYSDPIAVNIGRASPRKG